MPLSLLPKPNLKAFIDPNNMSMKGGTLFAEFVASIEKVAHPEHRHKFTDKLTFHAPPPEPHNRKSTQPKTFRSPLTPSAAVPCLTAPILSLRIWRGGFA